MSHFISRNIDLISLTNPCIVFFIIITPVLLSIVIALVFGFVDTYLHEFGHYIMLIVCAKKNPDFNEKLISHIKLKGLIRNKGGFLFSNYYQFLQDTKPKYLLDIKLIAISGMLLSTFLYAILLIIFIFMTIYYKNNIFIIPCGVFFVFIAREIIPYYISKNKFSDKNIFRYPETFEYHPELHK